MKLLNVFGKLNIRYNQSMKAKIGAVKADLKAAIDAAGGTYDIINSAVLENDYADVDFDFENFTDDPEEPFSMPGYELGYDELSNGIPVLWCAAGGDWEMPVAFCMYLGEDGKIHAYVPKDGNSFNKETNMAFGNDPDFGQREEIEKFGGYLFNMDAIRADTLKALA